MKAKTGSLAFAQLLFTGGLIVFSQLVFLKASLHEDLGLGRSGEAWTWANYSSVWTDPEYLHGLWLTLALSSTVVAVTLVLAWPAAWILSRMRPAAATAVLTAIVVTSFVPLPIKTLGLMIVFAADGVLLGTLRHLGLVDAHFRFLGSLFAVGVGYTHLGLAFMITLLFSTLQAVPQRLVEAARVHGASSWRALWRVVVPLSLPGTLGASLMLFNLLCGAFVSAALLGGGKVLTLPVLIQQSLILHAEYGVAATLAAVLLLIVVAGNLASVAAARRLTPGARVIA
jgi:putative spermidine/putrescine transport system permease protein